VNFNKSMLGVNVSGSWLTESSVVLNCKIGCIALLYLGLPICG